MAWDDYAQTIQGVIDEIDVRIRRLEADLERVNEIVDRDLEMVVDELIGNAMKDPNVDSRLVDLMLEHQGEWKNRNYERAVILKRNNIREAIKELTKLRNEIKRVIL